MDGIATKKIDSRDRRQPIEAGSQLSTGDVVDTETAARVRVSLLPGLLADIGESSELHIEQIRVAKDGNAMMDAMRAREVRLRLVRGSLTAVVEKNNQAIGTLTVDTPFGIVTAMAGTLCRIEVSDQRARIICLRGNLQMQARGGSGAMLETGFFEDWPSAIAAPRAVDEDAQVQAEVVAAFDIQSELLSLENRARFAPAPWRRTIPEKP